MTATVTHRPDRRVRKQGFGQLLRSEWTKFRTVRGWVIGMLVAGALILLFGWLVASGSHMSCGGASDVCPAYPVGPGGEAVDDNFYFVHRSLDGTGEITVRVTAMTGEIRKADVTPGVRNVVPGLVPWAKAGVIVKNGTRPGAAYAALMVTAKHGVRMQHNFTHDTAGSPEAVSSTSPRWLRLVRNGDKLTGYESTDGARWTEVGTARLTGLPATVQIGLFAASPGDVTVIQAGLGGSMATSRFAETTATFDNVNLQGNVSGGAWKRLDVGASKEPDGSIHHPGGAVQSGGTFTVKGSGDIAPRTDGPTFVHTLAGLLAGTIAVIVVAAGFVTAEYRRGLIRTTLIASPRRGRVLVAKALVIAMATFVVTLAAIAVIVPVGTSILHANGNVLLPTSTLTELRVMTGVAALLAVFAVFAFALGALFRRGAAAITAGVVLIVLPSILATASVLPVTASEWLLRITPAAGFAIKQTIPAYPHVLGNFTPQSGFYPLAPWAGFAVSCAYAALALGLAVLVVRRRDA